MYESFYNLKEKPFSLQPDSHFLYHSSKHDAALAQLQYGLLSQAGFCVITGNIGTGKTTLIRYLLDHIEKDVTLGLITNTHESFGEIIKWVSQAFDLEHSGLEKQTLYNNFTDFLIGEYAKGQHTVLIIDEAQNLSVEVLEELRVISNINADKDHVFQMILVGQLELKEKLNKPELLQFAQRITASYQLEPLTEDETQAYIRHRLRVAGGPSSLFTAQACREVYRYSGGVPRLINALCDTALVYGFANEKSFIGADLIFEVACDKSDGGIFPIAVKPDEHLRPAVIETAPDMTEENLSTDEAQVPDELPPESPAREEIKNTQPKHETYASETTEKNSRKTVSVDAITSHDATESHEKIAQQIDKKPSSIKQRLIGVVLLILVLSALFYVFQPGQATSPEPPEVIDQKLPEVKVSEREKPARLETEPATMPRAAQVQEIEKVKQKDDIVENSVTPSDNTSSSKTEQTSVDDIRSEDWILAQDPDTYTLHIASKRSRELAHDFIKKHEMQTEAAYLISDIQDITWHSVIYGIYPSRAAAIHARSQLPAEILSSKPWIRKIATIKNQLTASN